MKRKEEREKKAQGEEWEPWPTVWHSAHALSACGHWDVKLSQSLFLFLFLLPCSWLLSHACSLPLSAERSLVEIVLSICVQCALQVFNITPFTQSDEAMQSCSAVFKAAHLHILQHIPFICVFINDKVGPQLKGDITGSFLCKLISRFRNKTRQRASSEQLAWTPATAHTARCVSLCVHMCTLSLSQPGFSGVCQTQTQSKLAVRKITPLLSAGWK